MALPAFASLSGLFKFQWTAAPDDWLSGKLASPDPFETFEHWYNLKGQRFREGKSTAELLQAYLQEFENQRGANGVLPIIKVQVGGDDEAAAAVLSKLAELDKFGLQTSGRLRKIEFSDKTITSLSVKECRSLVLKNCRIRELTLGPSQIKSVHLEGSRIRRLKLTGGTRVLRVEGGEIWGVEVPEDEKVISGPVTLLNVKLPTDPVHVQGLRNLRAALVRIHNLEPAGHVHAAEQRLSLNDLPTGADRVFSRLYGFASGYGNETHIPLICAALLGMLSVDILLWLGGAEMSLRGASPVGWQETLSDSGPSAAVLRAAYLTASQIFNPLGTFGTNALVVASQPVVGLFSTLICLLSTASIGLFLIALRRRFRISG